MIELKLKFKDEKDKIKEIPVSGEEFFVGRHSENDLSIADSAISRRHLKIQRFADVFIVSDVGSTLGTKINGEEMLEPTALKNGDRLVLGESVEIEVLLEDENAAASDEPDEEPLKEETPAAETSSGQSSAAAGSSSGSSVPMSFFYIAPVLGVIALLLVGGIFLAIKSGGKKEVVEGNDFIYTSNRLGERNQSENAGDSDSNDKPENQSVPVSENINTDPGNSEIPSNIEINDPSPEPPANQSISNKTGGELAKIEINSASFLRRIAQKDPRAALTGRQQEIVRGKINQLKDSTALAANLRSARANAAQIQTLASQKNLKPQFLAAAALARLGNSPGNVLSEAQAMANVLDELSRNVGDEFSDDSLLVIAAYEQGAAGRTLEMRNMLQGLTDKFPESSRRIRTVWFLKNNNKISDSQFEFALRFLAVGTISQNPSDFGVNAEAVKF